MAKKAKVTITLDTDILERARLAADKSRMTLSDWFANAASDVIADTPGVRAEAKAPKVTTAMKSNKTVH
jgi:hypothetical protein